MKPLTKLPLKISDNLPLSESVEIHSMELTLSMSLNASSLTQKPKVSSSLEKSVEKPRNKPLNGFLLTTQETSQLSVLSLVKPLLQEEEWVTLVQSSPVEKVTLNLRLLASRLTESLLLTTHLKWEKPWLLS